MDGTPPYIPKMVQEEGGGRRGEQIIGKQINFGYEDNYDSLFNKADYCREVNGTIYCLVKKNIYNIWWSNFFSKYYKI